MEPGAKGFGQAQTGGLDKRAILRPKQGIAQEPLNVYCGAEVGQAPWQVIGPG